MILIPIEMKGRDTKGVLPGEIQSTDKTNPGTHAGNEDTLNLQAVVAGSQTAKKGMEGMGKTALEMTLVPDPADSCLTEEVEVQVLAHMISIIAGMRTVRSTLGKKMTDLERRIEGINAIITKGTTQTTEATDPLIEQTEKVRHLNLHSGHGLVLDHLSDQGLQTGLGHLSGLDHPSGQGHLLAPGHPQGQMQAPVRGSFITEVGRIQREKERLINHQMKMKVHIE